MKHRAALLLAMLPALVLTGCEGAQSALSGGGRESISTLFLTLVLTVGSAVIFLLVAFALWVSLAGPASWKKKISSNSIVVWGGIAFPTVVLSVLLFYGFALLGAGPAGAGQQDDDPLLIHVEGLQWWWRVTYLDDAGNAIETANEIRFPAGRTVKIELTSADVIHSFWIPAYAGKVDMIPGHTNTITIIADEPGTVRGQCAEYCGGAHALMAFTAITMEPEAFDEWLAEEAGPVTIAGSPGEDKFLQAGCGGCHTVRGTSANGSVGPDLTHVAGRQTIGAGILQTDRAAFLDWLERHQEIKPDNLMPDYDTLNEEDRASIATYLAGLD
jgi:cytochrome c oxidase subunit 2